MDLTKKTVMYSSSHISLFLMARVLILVECKNNFDYKGEKTPPAWIKDKKSSEGENTYLFRIVSGI